MKKSLWQKYNDMKKLNSINENMSTDVLIIGAGITGVSVAYNLINHKENVILIDRNKCCDGVTSKSTGKLTRFNVPKNSKYMWDGCCKIIL